jgi:hypothetical protein
MHELPCPSFPLSFLLASLRYYRCLRNCRAPIHLSSPSPFQSPVRLSLKRRQPVIFPTTHGPINQFHVPSPLCQHSGPYLLPSKIPAISPHLVGIAGDRDPNLRYRPILVQRRLKPIGQNTHPGNSLHEVQLFLAEKTGPFEVDAGVHLILLSTFHS